MHERIDCGLLIKHLLGNGHTTRTLGEAIGLSQPSVSRLATGRTKQTSARAVVSLIRLAGGRVELPDLPELAAAPAPSPAAPGPESTAPAA